MKGSVPGFGENIRALGGGGGLDKRRWVLKVPGRKIMVAPGSI